MMTRDTRLLRLACLMCVLLPCAEGRAADVVLKTTRLGFEKISIRVMGFGNAVNRAENHTITGESLVGVLEDDLRRTQLFEVVEQDAEPPDMTEADCENKAPLDAVGKSTAAVVTWGRLGLQNGKVIMEVCAHDGGEKTIALGRRYHGTPPNTRHLMRRMVHRWADELVKHYTSETGVASTRIIYVAGQRGENGAVHLMDYDGYRPQPITSPRAMALMPTWLPDQQSVVYTTYQRNNQSIVQLDLYSRAVRTLVSPGVLNITPALSHDGQLVAYASANRGRSDIFTVDMKTKQTRRLTRGGGADLSPTWSPDGRAMAFVSDRGGGPQIYVMNADGSNVRRLTSNGSYNAAPAWSPQGNWIAYVCRGRGSGFRLCRISRDGQRRVRITRGARWAMEDSPSWAPDGRHLVFSARKGAQSHLYMINVDGTGREQLTTGMLHHSSPDWSPS